MGHPLGATGAVLVTKALAQLEAIDGRFALVTMCIGGGMGAAACSNVSGRRLDVSPPNGYRGLPQLAGADSASAPKEGRHLCAIEL